jgi:hypothetical protein
MFELREYERRSLDALARDRGERPRAGRRSAARGRASGPSRRRSRFAATTGSHCRGSRWGGGSWPCSRSASRRAPGEAREARPAPAPDQRPPPSRPARSASRSASARSCRPRTCRTSAPAAPRSRSRHPLVDVMMLQTTCYQTRRHMGTWLALAKRGISRSVETADSPDHTERATGCQTINNEHGT